jgi:hypothetical protein
MGQTMLTQEATTTSQNVLFTAFPSQGKTYPEIRLHQKITARQNRQRPSEFTTAHTVHDLDNDTTTEYLFDRYFDLLPHEKKYDVLIQQSGELNSVHAKEIQNILTRIYSLSLEASQIDSSEQCVSIDSFRGFLKLMNSSPTALERPSMSLTPSGNIRAQWRKSNNHHLAIELVDKDNAKMVIFFPDPGDNSKIIRTAFTVSIDGLWQILRCLNAMPWLLK